MNKSKSYTLALSVLIMLFFIWGFLTVLNDILIPYLKKVFDLNYFSILLIQFSFFIAYFAGSITYFIISVTKGDPINKIGYKKGIILGLITSATGAFMFYPAAHYKVFSLFLLALFILALGFALLQIAANPYVSILGSEENASSRLNLAQAFNSLGTTLAPILGGFLVYTVFGSTGEAFTDVHGNPILSDEGTAISAQGVQIPYLIFGAVLLLLSIIIYITPLPKFVNTDKIKKDAGALKHKNLVFGMIAIFFYVGAEVSIGSLLINFLRLPEISGLTELDAKSFLAFYWGGAMIGRLLGAISLQKNSRIPKAVLMPLISAGLFLLIWFFVYIERGTEIRAFLPFIIFMLINLAGFWIGKSKAHTTLSIFAIIAISLVSTALLGDGKIAMWSLIGLGLFNSIMWSNIFTLAIKDLKEYTSQASSLLITAIVGGALIPLIQGFVSDQIGLHYSFFIPLISYIYIAFYGWKLYKPEKF